MRLVRYTYPSFRSLTPAFGGLPRSPWSGLESEISRLFESALSDLGESTAGTRFPVALYEDKNNTYVRAELPGVNRQDINVELVEGYLTIAAVRKTPAVPAGGEGEAATPGESFALSRSISITDEIQTDKIAAAYENGVLTVTLPKREEAKPKKITVTVN